VVCAGSICVELFPVRLFPFPYHSLDELKTSSLLFYFLGGPQRGVLILRACRFVTGLLDSHQTSKRKISMYALAKTLDLPATYVELRHQATHEELPSLQKLRGAARKALQWIWERYWADLTLAPQGGEEEEEDGKEWVRRIVREGDGEDWGAVKGEVRRRGEEGVLRALMDLQQEGEGERDSGLLLRAVRLSRRVMGGDEDEQMTERGSRSLEEVRRELDAARERLDQDENQEAQRKEIMPMQFDEETKAWAMWEGPWIPTPIGTVRC
jgi:ribosomal biogenesis protein LAS1